MQEGRNHSTTLRLGEEPETRVLLGGAGGATYGNHGTGIYEIDFFITYTFGNFSLNSTFDNVFSYSTQISKIADALAVGGLIAAGIGLMADPITAYYGALLVDYGMGLAIASSYIGQSADILAITSKSLDMIYYDGKMDDLYQPLLKLSLNYSIAFHTERSLERYGYNLYESINPAWNFSNQVSMFSNNLGRDATNVFTPIYLDYQFNNYKKR